MSGIEDTIEGMLVRAFGLTMHLASESRDADGNVCCCICGGDYGLINTVPGWGGVFVCRTCRDAETGDQS